MTLILDCSHYQAKIDFDKIKDPIILKCSEALTYVDPTFKERRETLRKKGLYLGSYHYFRDLDPVKQADFFLKNADWKRGEILVLDFEINCYDAVNKCKKFLDKVGKVAGDKWLYTNDARALKYEWPLGWKFWIARYSLKDNGTPQSEPNFKDWDIWQYSSKGKIDGISGYVDLNYAKTPPATPSEPTETPRMTMYSQNDPLWKNTKLGTSNLLMGDYGCLTSAICTLASWFGDVITPRVMAQTNFCYVNGLVLWSQLENLFEHIKFKARVRNFDENLIDEYLVKNHDTAVILNVDRGYHFVAALGKTQSGYRCVDSYSYPARIRVYKKSEISGFAVRIKK